MYASSHGGRGAQPPHCHGGSPPHAVAGNKLLLAMLLVLLPVVKTSLFCADFESDAQCSFVNNV